MEDLRPIVCVLVVAVRGGRHHVTLCGGIAAKFVRSYLDR
jgi:sulfite exporter TauE/SafE